MDDIPGAVFARYQELEAVGLAAPQITYIMQTLRARGMQVNADITTLEEAEREILQALEALC